MNAERMKNLWLAGLPLESEADELPELDWLFPPMPDEPEPETAFIHSQKAAGKAATPSRRARRKAR